MLSLFEIYQFINSNKKEDLKEYYNKCYDTLKEINKRSNLLSFFILILFVLNSFSFYVQESNVLGFKINQDVIKITSPLLVSYFLLEWCLSARRRRELLKVMKYIGFEIFNIAGQDEDFNFNHFGLHSRNVMPFSFMVEFLNVNYKSKTHSVLLLMFLWSVGIGMPLYIGALLYVSFTQYYITVPMLLCNLTGIYCLIQIVLFYKDEISSVKRIQKMDKEFIEKVTTAASD